MSILKKLTSVLLLTVFAGTVSASSTDFRYRFFNAITEYQTVGYDYFAVFDTVTVEIQTFDEFALGGTSGFDPVMYVFEYDGSLGAMLGSDDDSGVTAYSYNNSYLQLNLAPGSYAVAVSDFGFSESEARSGLNVDADNFGSYVLAVNTVSAVPEASTIAMMLSGLGVVGFAARRRRNSHC